MAEYDGEIRIKTVVDSSEIEKDIMNQKKSYEELAKEQDYLVKNQIKLEKEKAKLINKQIVLNERLIALSNREQKIRDKIEFTKKQSEFGNLPGGFFSPKEEMKLKHYQLDLNEVISKESRLKKEIESVNSAIDSNITNLNKTSEILKINASSMESIEKSIEEISKIKTEIEEIQKGIEESDKNIEELKKGFSEIAKSQMAIKKLNEALDNMETSPSEENLKKLNEAFKNLGAEPSIEGIKKLIESLKKLKEENAEKAIKKLNESLKNLEIQETAIKIGKLIELLGNGDTQTKRSKKAIRALIASLKDLQQIEQPEEVIKKLNESLDNVKTDQSRENIEKLIKSLKDLKSMSPKQELLETIKTEKPILSITKLKSRFQDLNKAFINFANKEKESKNFDGFSKPLANNIKSASNYLERFSNRIFNLAKTAFVFNVIRSGFNELSKGLRALISSDDVLSSSLNEIRANLLTAFAPIYQAAIPALRELGRFLSWASLQLATFMSALFGKTLSQSQKSAYEMSAAINSSTKSLKKQSKGLKSVSKEAEKTSDVLASFDKIEVLDDKSSTPKKNEEQQNELPPISPPSINKKAFKKVDSEISSFWEKIANRIKEPFKNLDLSRLTGSFEKLKQTLSNFGKSTVEGLWWIYENVLAPFATWTISEVLPRFFDVFSASLEAIQPIAKQAGEDLKNLYDIFLKPIAEWTGSKVIEFLEGFSDALNRIADFFGDGNNKVYLEWLVSFLEGLASTLVLSGIKKLATLITVNLVPAIWAMTTAFFSNPWNWVVLGISSVITAIIMISKHWDEMKKYFNDAWEGANGVIDGLKQRFNGFKTFISGWIDFIGGLFTLDWTRIWKAFVNIVIGSINRFTGTLNVITSAIRAVWNIIAGVINLAVDSINNVGFKLPDWLGGNEFKLRIKRVETIPINAFKIPTIPALAQGAVLDGSNPFLAWVNDQPKGQTNIETPLNTMVEAFNTALKGNSTANNVIIQASGDVSQLISYLHFELKKENSMIGDNMITGDVYV